MADSNQLKRIDPVGFDDEDPFAELTRIMGFDPRVPVRPAASAAQVSSQAATPAAAAPLAADPEPDFDLSVEDFSIDLEKELLGDFALEEEPQEIAAPTALAAAPVFEPEAAARDAEADLDLDVAVAADLDNELSLADPVPAVSEAAGEPDHGELLADGDFDAAFEHELVGELRSAHDEPVHDQFPSDGDEQPKQALSVEDVALLAALEPEGAAELAEPVAQEQDLAPEQAEEPRGLAVDEIDLDFDVAMADVDMDFIADPDVDADMATSHEAAPSPVEQDHADPYQAGAIDFDDPDEAAFEGVSAVAEAPTETAFTETAYADAAEADEAQVSETESSDAEAYVGRAAGELDAGSDASEPEELSLEDELNALLGNSVPRAELTGGYDAPPLTATLAEHEEPAVDDLADFEVDNAAWDPLAPVAGDDPASDAHAPTVEAYPLASEVYGEEAVPDAAGEAFADDYAGPSYQVAEVQYAEDRQEVVAYENEAMDEQAAEDELDFDDGAFHAAFENSLVSDEEPEAVDDSYAVQHAAGEAAPERDADGFGLYRSHAAASPAYANAVPLAPAAVDEDIPDIDTVDVPETAIAMADDLDIPEVAYEEEVRAAPAYDEFESEFAAAFAKPAQLEEGGIRQGDAGGYAPAERDYGQRYVEARTGGDDAGYGYAAGIAAVAGAAYASTAKPAAARQDFDDSDDGFDAVDLPGSRKARAADPFDAMDYDSLDEEIALPAYVEHRAEPRRRGLLIAAIVGGVAVLGGVGAFALSLGGGAGTDVPAIVRADDSPIKVRPENPGGTTVPNQDNKVYETVAGGGAPSAPSQEKLISSAEEPVDMAVRAPVPTPEAAPELEQATGTDPSAAREARVVDEPVGGDEIAAIAAKAEDRVEPSAATAQSETDNTEVAAVAPRRVRTMMVRPDGTLVPRQDPAPVAPIEPQGAAEAMMESAPAASVAEPEVANSAGPTLQAPVADPVPVQPEAPAKPTKGAPKAAAAGTPASVPVAPARPADQPVDVVGEVKPQRVAAISPSAAATGAWSMQIASQPSEDAAKSTYEDLARRYPNVLGGRDVTIVKAEIAGKGTFWRVRVPAGSRNEAIGLCESYKSAGGNCFVSK